MSIPDPLVTQARTFLTKTYELLEYAGDKFEDNTRITEFAKVWDSFRVEVKQAEARSRQS